MTNRKQHERYRDKDQIYFEILKTVKDSEPTGGIYKTKLLYMTRLIEVRIKPHLQTLLDNELIIKDSTKSRIVAASKSGYRKASTKGITYHITQKGLRYLNMAEEMQRQTMSAAGIRI